MNKSHAKEPLAKDVGAPAGLVTCLAIGVPFFCALTLQALFSDIKDPTPSFTMAAFLVQGLLICFYWRRLKNSWQKKVLAWFAAGSQWMFMTLVVLAGAMRNFVVHIEPVQVLASVGLGAILCSSFLFLIAFAVDHKGVAKVQALVMTAFAAILIAGLAFTRHEFTDISPAELAMAAKSFPDVAAHNAADHAQHAAPGKGNTASWQHDAIQRLRHENALKQQKSTEQGARYWGYAGEGGPDYWAMLDSEFKQCSAGREQSPVDIPREAKAQDVIKFKYENSNMALVDNGHTVQLTFDAGSLAYIDGKRYELQQLHFHSPSEHTIGGVSYPMEVHFVHKSASGEVAFIAALVEKGNRNHLIDVIWNYLPEEKNLESRPRGIQLNAMDLLPKNRTVFRYAGSLTTPPCTEGVAWNVLRQPIQMSHEQIEQFRRLYPHNSRPVQNLNRRHVGLSTAPQAR